jgi:prepilin peptidase CpaA
VDRTFFPDPFFAWVFCLTLIALASIAAWTDTRRAKIPNRLTVIMLAIGLLANVVRGGWLGAENKPLWILDSGSVWLGIGDGLLFGAVGFLVTFSVMFTLWIFGTCGGGDVKLLAAIGAWLGITYFPLVLLATAFVAILWMGARLLRMLGTPRGNPGATAKSVPGTVDQSRRSKRSDREAAAGREPVLPRRFVRVTYSLPLLIALTGLLLYLFRYELELAPKPLPAQTQGATAHVGPSTHEIETIVPARGSCG